MGGQSIGEDPFFPWRVPVRDPAGREQQLRIGIRDRQVVALPPPGEGFTLTAQSARLVATYFRAAADVAESQP